MTRLRLSETENEAIALADAIGEYANPPAVAQLKGPAAHEVAVGPVHAGVIEPGHFRFQCMGEDVYNLQIFLGYQHRGVEQLIVAADGHAARQAALAETCAGDTAAAAATAYAQIMETAFPERFPAPTPETLRLRAIMLELERIANHTGDLGALAGDVAFLQSAAFCGRIRGDYLNLTALICGNRFGRHTIIPGGARAALDAEKTTALKKRIAALKGELDRALELMFESPSVVERFEGTGRVPKDVADAIGLCGPAGRAARELNGDVLSRALVRRTEIDEAHRAIAALLAAAPEPAPPTTPEGRGQYRTVTATVNAWRGTLTHAAAFDPRGRMLRYRIADPSARNWHGLAWAMRGEQISNFPICNKSFNLSYCGADR